jgi:hypothetical protein
MDIGGGINYGSGKVLGQNLAEVGKLTAVYIT